MTIENRMGRSLVFCLLFLIMALLAVIMVSSESTSTNDGVVIAINLGGRTGATANRKLKERSFEVSMSLGKALGSINQEDYPNIDPSPSSKAAIHYGPIEHGTPLMPYIPGPTPSVHPKHGSP